MKALFVLLTLAVFGTVLLGCKAEVDTDAQSNVSVPR
jgi:hypothetical protein